MTSTQFMLKNASELCSYPQNTNLNSCKPESLMLVKLLMFLFGYNRDGEKGKGYSETNNLCHCSDKSSMFDTAEEDILYDFVIVGAGSAGCVIANRLTEICDWKVLLLEAGIEEPLFADVPSLSPYLPGSNIDWNYFTIPDNRSCKALPGGRCAWPRGKVMGGSSTLNYMMYFRGNKQDYEEWKEMGNKGWGYNDVLKYFIKWKDNRDPDVYNNNPKYHGRGGYQTVECFPYTDPNVPYLIKAWREKGLKEGDLNAARQIGVMHTQSYTRNGERLSANGAYIRPIRQERKNLKILTEAYVTRVLLQSNKDNKQTAYGVEFIHENVLKMVRVKKEVILSAGAINSPKILMLSGIGPEGHLRERNIEIKRPLEGVGQNLMDHTTTMGIRIALPKTAQNKDYQTRVNDAYRYKKHRDGPLSTTALLECGVFLQTKYERSEGRPDFQYTFSGSYAHDWIDNPVNASAAPLSPFSYYDAITVASIVLNPESRGFILLNESSPAKAPPLIYARTFSKEHDLKTLVAGMQIVASLVETKAMRDIGAYQISAPVEYCGHLKFGSDDYWACIATYYTGSLYHYAGTCKMGRKDDEMAVVDDRLRVHGVCGLRVADAGIMPRIVRGNTNGPTLMIGEKASDMIKEDWGIRGNMIKCCCNSS